MNLKELIDCCTDPHSPHREVGWRELIKRYNPHIYQQVTRRCVSWNVPRLRRQLSATVNDVVSEVYIILFRYLGNFREVENEQKFRYWISTICTRAAGRYLQRQYVSDIVDSNYEEFKNYFASLPIDTRWELYESIVVFLRSNTKKGKRYLERDIHIFHLYLWADCTAKMISRHPCLEKIGHRVVDNVVNRIRSVLRQTISH